jgi:hypothetical protein
LVPRSHFAVGHSLGCVVFLRRTAPTTVKRPVRPLFEFRLPPEYCPAQPSPPAAAGRLLSWALLPFSTPRIGGPPDAGQSLPAAFRLQGLATLLTAYSLRAPAGFISHRRRSWDSPFGAFPFRKVSAAFPRGSTHLPFNPPVIPPPERWAGPAGRGSWALTLPGVPGDRTGVNSPTAGCSLGLYPSRACQQEPCPGFRPSSSHALRKTGRCDRLPAPRSLNRLTLGFVQAIRQAGQQDKTTLVGFSHRYDPEHSSDDTPGLCVHLMPRCALLPTGRQSWGVVTSLYRSCSGFA